MSADPVHLILLGVAAGKRVRLQQAARAALGLAPAQVLDWRAWLAQPDLLQQAVDAAQRRPCVLKIDAPGEDAEVHHQLLQMGAASLDHATPAALAYGELRDVHLWFAGLRLALQQLQQQMLQLSTRPALCNTPSDILLMGDKLACQQHLLAHGLPVPPLLGQVQDYAQLRSLMRAHGLQRVFLKARYGSSAAGVLALRCAGPHLQGFSSAHLADDGRIGAPVQVSVPLRPRRQGMRRTVARHVPKTTRLRHSRRAGHRQHDNKNFKWRVV